KIGMVQFRWGHLNRDFSLLTKLQSIFLDGHFVIEQTARHRSGRFFNFNGTAGIWRKEAIASAGGWQSDTLTEDLDLSYRAQLAGWEFIYLADVVCEAELPIEMNSYKTQQHRWAKGSVQTAKKLLPVIWKSGLPWPMKIEATFHLTNNLSYLFMLIPLILILPSLALWLNLDWNKAFLIYTFFFITTTLSVWFYFACSQKEIYKNWKTVLKYLPILLPLGIGLWVNNTKAALEGLWNYKTEFVRTPKYGIEKKLAFLTPLKYQSQPNWVSLAEIIFFGYLTLTIFYAWMNKIYVAIPLLLVFQIGFGIVAILSWLHSRKFKQIKLGFNS
ncbi:MAG: glycosyltransferase, partial [candidate division Zixibacteria bacterium]|nr:glycosyltransferase [candidate division Zixibacteria bacterium]